MTPQQALLAVGEPEKLDAVAPGWEHWQDMLPPGRLSFLTAECIRLSADYCRLPTPHDLLLQVADHIEDDPALRALAWQCHQQLYEDAKFSNFLGWPDLNQTLGDNAAVFYLLVALDCIPRLRAARAGTCVPEEITRANSTDVATLAWRYNEVWPRRPGMDRRVMSWFRLVASGDLYRLGRLQYVWRAFMGPLRAYRNVATGAVVALAEAGQHYADDGLCEIAGFAGSSAGFTTVLEQGEDWVRGHLLHPAGHVLRRQVTLPLQQWRCVLQKGDMVLEIHIPEGPPMTPEACRDSFTQAVSLFPEFRPDQHFKALACYSWILNPDLQQMMPPQSNLVQFEQQLYLYPWPGNGLAGLFFIFGREDVNPASTPARTTLEKALLRKVAAGQPLHNGAMFFLPEDLPHYGGQKYRQDHTSLFGSPASGNS